MAKIGILNDLLKKNDKGKSRVADRLLQAEEAKINVENPPFPKIIQVETTNICNHGCVFCAYTKMERPKRLGYQIKSLE